MSIGNRVRRARKSARLTQAKLGKMVGVQQATISDLEKGESRSSAYLVQIAHACKVNAEWLATGQGDMHDPDSQTQLFSSDIANLSPGPARFRHVPEISWVQAGEWTEIDILDLDIASLPYWPCPVSCSDQAFVLRVEGDSMSPYFPQGSLIFVDPEVMPISGKKVVALLTDTNQATFKQYIEDGGQKMLKAMNPNWPQPYIPINGNCRIVGTVIFSGIET